MSNVYEELKRIIAESGIKMPELKVPASRSTDLRCDDLCARDILGPVDMLITVINKHDKNKLYPIKIIKKRGE